MEAQDEKQSTPLYWAACRGHTEMVSFLVFDAKANPSAANIFRSCLHIAAGTYVQMWLCILSLPISLTFDQITAY